MYVTMKRQHLLGGAQGRSPTKALVVVAAEEVGRGIGRIRMRRIPDGMNDRRHVPLIVPLGAACPVNGGARLRALVPLRGKGVPLGFTLS